MLCCKLKIFYHLVLTAYHGCDVYFDWSNFRELIKENAVSAAGILISTNSSLVKAFFVISCVTGNVFSIIMILAYGYHTSSSTGIAFTMQATDPLSIHMANFRFSAIVDVTRNATANSSHFNYGSRF